MANTFMSRVAAYRKAHPRTSQVEAMKKLAGKKAVGKTAPAKKTTARKTISKKIVSGVKHTRPKKDHYAAGMAIIKKIDTLEAKLKREKSAMAKDLIKRLINAEHDKYDLLTGKKKRSA